MNSIKTSKLSNQTDGVDETSCLKGELFACAHKIPEYFKRNAFRVSSIFKTDVEFSVEEFWSWPLQLGKEVKKILDEFDTLSKMAMQLGERWQYVTGQTIRMWYYPWVGIDDWDRIREEVDFPYRSGKPVSDAIQSGERGIVSRVLETNIDWIVSKLYSDLDSARKSGKEPELILQLSEPKMLPLIAQKESDKLSIEEKVLDYTRGISYYPDITAIRHIALWAGTLRAISIMHEKFKDLVEVYLKNGEPSARGNIAQRTETDFIRNAFCVSMSKWDIGLDSDFHKIIDPDLQALFKKRMFEESKKITETESALEESYELEQRLLANYIDGRRIRDVVLSVINKLPVKDSPLPWKKMKSDEGGFVEWFRALPEDCNFDDISKAQRLIDNAILPAVRKELKDIRVLLKRFKE